ncbi:hypothetical protein NV379_14550 [Paenibacillus sp. N1-5-1-14]|uniref:hypothetical protein n=1 Tax=Paenibacillus radicibacter TaxID=2972488 RepID=UPI0021593999|nr:hypothetical protein [Paenibacillus radicibacter]MCR8643873.1 hypothetical protein [Paenibacillus radicibacter]
MNLRSIRIVGKMLLIIVFTLSMIFAFHKPGIENLHAESTHKISIKEGKKSIARLTHSTVNLKRLIEKMVTLSLFVYLYASICYVLLTSVHLFSPSIARVKKQQLLRPIKFTSQYVS